MKINSLKKEEAAAGLFGCCGCKAWTDEMVAALPFDSEEEMFKKSEDIMRSLERVHWLEAFSHHSKIGDIETLKSKFSSAENEQAGVRGASDEVINEMMKLNEEYEKKFDFIFIVFATGKSADEMLSLLRARISNDRETEIMNALNEQIKITKNRLQRLI